MSEGPSNGELAVMIKGIREVLELRFNENDKDHKLVNTHLKELNGQVVKNTKFRWQVYVYGSLAIVGIPLMLKEIIDKIF